MPLPVSAAELLSSLPGSIRVGQTPEAHGARIPSGYEALDRLLDGGFPCGRLSEVCGRPSTGRTSLLFGLLRKTTTRGTVAALIDGADRFDPFSAETAGVSLRSVLWVRPPEARPALRCAEILLGTRGFGLVVLDLADAVPPALAARLAPAWARLARCAAGSGAPLVVLSDRRLSGSFAHLCLSLTEPRPLWPGHRLRNRLFGGIEAQAEIVRTRDGAAGRTARVSFSC